MKINKVTSCKHQYIVGYSFRMPQPLFRDLPCDNCGCRIKLSFSWKLLYISIECISLFLAYTAATSVHIRFLGSTFLISLAIFISLSWIFQQINRLVLRYGRWIEAE